MAAATAEAAIRFTVVDAEMLSLIGLSGDETPAKLCSNSPSPLSPTVPLQSDVSLGRCLQISCSIFYLLRCVGELACTPLRPASSLAFQQSAEAIDNNSPPSSGHTNGIPVAEWAGRRSGSVYLTSGVGECVSPWDKWIPSPSSVGRLRVNTVAERSHCSEVQVYQAGGQDYPSTAGSF